VDGRADVIVNQNHIGFWPQPDRQSSQTSFQSPVLTRQASNTETYRPAEGTAPSGNAQGRAITATEIMLIQALPEPSLRASMADLLRGTSMWVIPILTFDLRLTAIAEIDAR
jgi:hypothetical protein